MSKVCVLALAGVVLASPVLAKDVKRCGWYSNPTPGNHWITDADSTWLLATQGGPEAPGWADLPGESFDFEKPGYWVKTNVNYGYGCACITGRFGSFSSGKVLRVKSITVLPLSRCEADPALPEAEG